MRERGERGKGGRERGRREREGKGKSEGKGERGKGGRERERREGERGKGRISVSFGERRAFKKLITHELQDFC